MSSATAEISSCKCSGVCSWKDGSKAKGPCKTRGEFCSASCKCLLTGKRCQNQVGFHFFFRHRFSPLISFNKYYGYSYCGRKKIHKTLRVPCLHFNFYRVFDVFTNAFHFFDWRSDSVISLRLILSNSLSVVKLAFCWHTRLLYIFFQLWETPRNVHYQNIISSPFFTSIARKKEPKRTLIIQQ